MATHQIQHNDVFEYVKNIKQLGGNEQMAEYQARYIEQSTTKTIDDAIAKLHLERFATKEDLAAVEHRLDAKIDKVEYRLEEKINKVAYELEKFKISIENKLFKHTVFIVAVVIITNLPNTAKHILSTLLHI